jgi:choline dehydrogenase-like flavoprotein
MDQLVEGWKGVHQGYQVREFIDQGYMMAAVNIPPAIVAMTLGYYGQALNEIMRDYNRMVIAGVLVEDTVAGRVRLGPAGQPMVFYQLTPVDVRRLLKGCLLVSELLFEVGAERIYTPFDGIPPLRSVDDLRLLRERRIDSSAMEVATVHIMGTAAMGSDPRRHVCDPYGRVYGTSGLFVVDASLFPGPLGVNPMETIMALSTRVSERALERRLS